jgi:hypothetical protein
VVLAEVAAAAGQGVFVELHLGPAVITSHPRIVAPAARVCQAPAIDEHQSVSGLATVGAGS